MLGEIDDVQRDDRWKTKLNQLNSEAEVIVEVRRIENDDQRIGLALSFLAANQNVASYGFVRARGIEAVRTGKIDELGRAAVGERHPAGVTFDRYAGIIADLLASARKRVEQRALAGIWAAGDGD